MANRSELLEKGGTKLPHGTWIEWLETFLFSEYATIWKWTYVGVLLEKDTKIQIFWKRGNGFGAQDYKEDTVPFFLLYNTELEQHSSNQQITRESFATIPPTFQESHHCSHTGLGLHGQIKHPQTPPHHTFWSNLELQQLSSDILWQYKLDEGHQ